MNLSRRAFIKANAAASAAAVAGISMPAVATNLIVNEDKTKITWDKAPCRFCGTGCSVLVGTQSGRVVATQGDPEAPVNRGLNCIKGYFLSKIMYGSDRLQTPLLRMKDGKYDKNGDFEPVSWDTAFDIMAEKWKAALKKRGPHQCRHVWFGSVDRDGGIRGVENDEGRVSFQQYRSQCAPLHGLRGRWIHAQFRH